GDRSIAFALHALISAADSSGVAEFDRVAVIYRDDHLAALRAAGRDAEREAGRLSLDEVRYHLARVVFPRLAADGVIIPPTGGIPPPAKFRFADRIGEQTPSPRDAVAPALQYPGEHSVVAPPRPPQPPTTGAGAPSSGAGARQSVLEAKGLVKTYRR